MKLLEVLACVVIVGSLGGCSTDGGSASGTIEGRASAPATSGVLLPPPNGVLDYQLGGAYPPAEDVVAVSRDRTDAPVPGLYNICYVNGFQSQPGEADLWLDEHPSLVLRDGSGTPVVDPEWPDEFVLDISTPDRRTELAAVVGPWIDGCARDGFQAVEIDNLDTFTRFPDRVREDDAVAMARVLADRAHADGLAIGQKNAAELLPLREESGLDFAVVEQCNEFDECDEFTSTYGELVYVVEYDQRSFDRGCERFPQISIVLRDVDVSVPGTDTYLRRAC